MMPQDPGGATGPQENAGQEAEAAVDVPFDLAIDIEPFLPEAVHPFWNFMQDYPVLLVLLLVSLGYGLGKGLQWMLRSVLSQAAKRTESELDDKLVSYLTTPVVQTTVILAAVAAVKSFGFSDQTDALLVRLLFTLLIIFWARAWFKATHLALEVMSSDVGRFSLFDPRTRPLFEMGIKLFLLSVFIWLFMAMWDIDGTAWLASAGVIGIAVGFAARDTLANLISGVSIVADAPYKIGDYIVLDTGERGVVTKLGMRSTRLLTRDDVEISIPNAVMGNAKITNESGGPATEHRIRIPVGVAYGTSPRKVVELLEKVAREDELILDHPAPRARMRGFGESSLDFELLGWIRYPEQRGLAMHQLLITLEQAFRDEGIEIPFPQRDVHLKPGAGGAGEAGSGEA
jgi:small-conductance mechanosensitive channel